MPLSTTRELEPDQRHQRHPRPPARHDGLPGEFERFRTRLAVLARLDLGPLLRCKVDPDDLVQEAFLAATAAADSFRGTGDEQLFAWLRAVLSSRIEKLVRRYGTQARDVRQESPLRLTTSGASSGTNGLDPVADQTTPSQAAQRNEDADRVAAALGSLPDDYRAVLVYRNIDGLTFPEVADRLGRSVGAVTMLWARAVRAFRLAYPGTPS